MFNNNAFKTSMIFLGIIFFGIMLRMFLVEDGMFVKNDSKNGMANTVCVFDKLC